MVADQLGKLNEKVLCIPDTKTLVYGRFDTKSFRYKSFRYKSKSFRYKWTNRTNNDIEGWHLGLNRRAAGKSQLPLYLLISLLHREARLTSLQIRLVSEKKLRRIQRKKFRDLQTKIFALWDKFSSGECSARKLLKACSYLNGPAAS